jgi:alpha-L-fucosidase
VLKQIRIILNFISANQYIMKLFPGIILILSVVLLSACSNTPPPSPYGPLPSERQLAWHEMEFYAFVHFNMNTFTDKEWGFGDENPSLFNPSALDCRQWAKICRDAGMKGIIITAKHHDGFCLWPSEYTEHSVRNSSWKNGQGDVIRELADACRKYNLKMGIYLSPWDRNNADYGKPEYIEYYRNQLRELLTGYGKIFEVWFDGANGGTGYYGGKNETRLIDRKTYYDWPNTQKIVRELQPGACMFSDAGPDVRWCGNEQGWVNSTNWNLLRLDEYYPGCDCAEKLRTGDEDGNFWVPAEVDVSIRPGWFYHESEDTLVKSFSDLEDIYLKSVGRGASLLLNIPVDRRGLIHENDAEQLVKFAEKLRSDFADEKAYDKNVSASNVRGKSNKFRVSNVNDRDNNTYWTTDDSVTTASVVIDLKAPTEIRYIIVQEYIRLGQRVKAFSIDALVENDWIEIASGTTIGYKRILGFKPVMAKSVRLSIHESKACPVISNIGIY